MQHCKIVDLDLLLHWSIKSNDEGMFCCTLFQLCPIFFVTNHQNYARLMTYYALELVYIKNETPEVMEALMKGAFSINRSGNAFAGVPVDMALEQSINAHAKNRLKEIMAYADIDSAVNRWHVTMPMRSEIANTLLEYADMRRNEGGNKEVTEQRKKRDKEDLEKLKKLITSTINPFQQRRHKDYLFSLKTGKQVTKVAETYLLNERREETEGCFHFRRSRRH